ncbi:ATP-binding protein [Streptomyces sp. NPDC053431]|uniref:ATP-binding protein n=1 Tax=Streptomyces sp. NPDC053431 TaxID=3365703 RepID=UPI0037D56888
MEPNVLLEREEELEALEHALQLLKKGSGSFVGIEGGAGMGKSQILAYAKEMGETAGIHVLTARGSELEREYPFGAVRQLFESEVFGADTQKQKVMLSGRAAPAMTILGAVDSAQEPVGDLSALYSLYWLVSNLAHQDPLMLIIDDLHWVDETSLNFLTYLLPRLEETGVLLLGAFRQWEPHSTSSFRRIATSQSGQIIKLPPLSEDASGKIIRKVLSVASDPVFIAACANASSGNPMLLQEVAAELRLRGVEPIAENVDVVADLAVDAVGRRVRRWIGSLAPESVALARGIAVMGGQELLGRGAALADISESSALAAVQELEIAELFIVDRTSHAESHWQISYVHPLVQAAVYETLTSAERIQAHRNAAAILKSVNAEPERIAIHLLRVPTVEEKWTQEVLREAASHAMVRGAPEIALKYLQQGLHGALSVAARRTLLNELGRVAGLVDLPAAAEYLQEALELTESLEERAEIAYLLGRVWFYLGRSEEAVSLYHQALEWVGPTHAELTARLYSGIVQAEWLFIRPQPAGFRDLLTTLRAVEPKANVGSRMLDGVIASHDTIVLSAPSAVERARRALADNLLIEKSNADVGMVHAWVALLAADCEEAMISLDLAIARAHEAGSTYALTAALVFRGLGWLWRGELQEAEDDLRAAKEAAESAQVDVARLQIGPYLTDVLTEQGHLADAREALEWTNAPDPLPPFGTWFYFLDSRARLWAAQENHIGALESALEAGRRLADIGATNPAYVAWRSEAALSLHALHRADEAQDYANQELELARSWGSPRALGRSLRVAGLLENSRERKLSLLSESVSVLRSSPARLEYAKSLTALGAMLRRTGTPREARLHLSSALKLAQTLHAAPLAEQAKAELRAAGIKPRRSAVTGLEALTPSERRIAELAAQGRGNRDIAQQLFITTKTVEAHLSNVYRKLGTKGRAQLSDSGLQIQAG